MNRQPVQSSNIKAIGYDSTTKTLEVEFLNGNTYQYFDVPVEMYENMMKAESKGKFLTVNVKTGGFSYKKLVPIVEVKKDDKKENEGAVAAPSKE